jgi:cell wall-associated NlpC family hydrolase
MKILLAISLIFFTSCKQQEGENVNINAVQDTMQHNAADGSDKDEGQQNERKGNQQIQTGNTTPQELLAFAQTLIGVPYKYGAIDPLQGFDCSGFITYVFNHFNIAVPRSSIDFTNMQREINREDAKPGDIILFTGTDSTMRKVGHMGIIVSDTNGFQFIHSSSGKANGVTITPLNEYYSGRFVKVLRIFKQNDID